MFIVHLLCARHHSKYYFMWICAFTPSENHMRLSTVIIFISQVQRKLKLKTHLKSQLGSGFNLSRTAQGVSALKHFARSSQRGVPIPVCHTSQQCVRKAVLSPSPHLQSNTLGQGPLADSRPVHTVLCWPTWHRRQGLCDHIGQADTAQYLPSCDRLTFSFSLSVQWFSR